MLKRVASGPWGILTATFTVSLLLTLLTGAPARSLGWRAPQEETPEEEPQCLVTATPDCENEPNAAVTFLYIMTNTADETKHYVVTHDMVAAFLFSIPEGQAIVLKVEITVGTDTFRLHPKAWCKIFDEDQLKPAQDLQKEAQKEVEKITKQLSNHSGRRVMIETKEMVLITAIESQDEQQIKNLDKQLDKMERKDEEKPLSQIKEAQDAITKAYGQQPDADAEIVLLNLIPFKTPQLGTPTIVGPDDDFAKKPSPPDFEKGPERVPDDKEDDPGVSFNVNTDNDDMDDLLDIDDSDVSVELKNKKTKDVEDELIEFWWFYAKPVDGADILRVNKQSTKIRIWDSPNKNSQPQLPKEIIQTFDRDRLFVEAEKPSASRLDEVVNGFYNICRDKFHMTAAGLVFLDKDIAEVKPADGKGLRVATLEKAIKFFGNRPNITFELEGASLRGNVDKWAKEDERRYFIQVEDKDQKDGAKPVVKLASREAQDKQFRQVDPPTENSFVDVELEAVAGKDKTFRSKALILMSDDPDDDYTKTAFGDEQTGSAQDDAKNDRTMKVEIAGTSLKKGGILFARFTNAKGDRTDYPITICDVKPKEKLTTKVHFIVIATAGANNVLGTKEQARQQASDDLAIMKERFLQACIDVEEFKFEIVKDPTGNILNGTEEFGRDANGKIKASADQLAIIKAVSDLSKTTDAKKKDHIDIIYIDHFLTDRGTPSNTGGNTFSIDDITPDQNQDKELVQVCMVARRTTTPEGAKLDLLDPSQNDRNKRPGWIIVTHEFGHVIINAGHPPPFKTFRHNLMFESVISTNTLGGTKRLFLEVIGGVKQIEHARRVRPFIK